jgi:hypothetical protein
MYRDDGGEASDTTDAFKELELMAISRIWARSYARSGGNGEAFIRTLWIVRDADDIAYRRGVAFVEEGYWTTFAINGAGRQPIRLG